MCQYVKPVLLLIYVVYIIYKNFFINKNNLKRPK